MVRWLIHMTLRIVYDNVVKPLSTLIVKWWRVLLIFVLRGDEVRTAKHALYCPMTYINIYRAQGLGEDQEQGW